MASGSPSVSLRMIERCEVIDITPLHTTKSTRFVLSAAQCYMALAQADYMSPR